MLENLFHISLGNILSHIKINLNNSVHIDNRFVHYAPVGIKNLKAVSGV